MKELLGAETLKLRTLLLPRLATVIAAVLSGVIGFAIVRVESDAGRPISLADVAAAPAQPMWFLAVLVAVLATAGEFHHRTIHTTLLHTPRRARVLAAKAAVSSAYGASLTMIGAVSALTVGAITMRSEHLPVVVTAEVWTVVAASMLVGAVWSVLAAGLGLLVRNNAVALVGVLLWKFVVENVLPVIMNAPELRRWMPSTAADAVLYGGDSSVWLEPLSGGALFLGYAALVTLAAGLVFLRRDAT